MTTSEGFFQFLSPSEIYQMITGGPGTSDLVFAQAQANQEWSTEEERSDLIKALADTISSGWQGEASSSAYGAAMPLRERTLQNAANLEDSQDLLSRQIESFSTAYNSVREISEPPEQPLDDVFPFDVDHDKQVADYQADVQHNIAVFQQYDGGSEYNETNMPQEFHAGGRDGGDVSVKSPDTIGVGEPQPGPGTGPGDGSPGSGGPGDVGERGNPGGPSGYPGESTGHPGSSGGSTGSSGDSGGGTTAPNGYRPSSGSAYPSTGYSHPLSGQQAAVSAAPGGFVGGGSVGGYSGGGAGGDVAERGPAVRGPGSAVGAGALAAEENAVRRGMAGAAARGGVGPVGAPLGTGHKKEDADAEHERKVLMEADSEEIFGSDVLTAPQVIGDDEYED